MRWRERRREIREIIILLYCHVQLGYIWTLFIEEYNDLGNKLQWLGQQTQYDPII